MKQRLNRKLSEFEKNYLEELVLYDKVLAFTHIISINQHEIKTDGRGIRAVKIFTRQTLTAISLSKLLPRPSQFTASEYDLWDISSIASLTRNLLEGYLNLHFWGLEKISDSEAELRFFLLQLHKNIEWYNLRKDEIEEIELKEYEEAIAEQKDWVKNHDYLPNLTSDQRKKALHFSEMYKIKLDFETALPICKNLRHDYRLLSNLVHPLPLSIERINNERGRGLANDIDVSYCIMCIMIARKYLAASAIGIVENFPNDLENKLKVELELIKPLEKEGFD